MAVVKNIKINVDTKDAVKETDNLTQSLKEVDGQAEKTGTGIKDVGENGGAIAILDSLTGGLATRFRDAYEATKLFNFSLKGTRAALIATGVGAFLVALGAIVVYWDEIKDAIKGTTENLQTQLDLTKAIQSNLELQVANIDKQLELGKLQGKTNEALEKQKIALLVRLQEQNDAEQKLLKNQLKRLKATSTEVSFWDSIVGNIKFSLFGAKGLADEATRITGERLTAIKALEDQILAAQGKAIDLESTLFKINNPDREALSEAKDLETKLREKIIEGNKTFNDLLLEEEQRFGDGQVEIRRGTAQDILDAERTLIEAKQDLRNIDIDNIRGVVGIVGLLGDESKALQAGVLIATNAAGIAKTIINTQAANAIATAEGVALAIPTFGASTATAAALVAANNISAGISIATSVAATAKGLSQLGGGGSPTGGNVGGGGGRPSAPSFNLVSGTATNQIANSIGNQPPVQSFVVSTAVTSSQELDRNAVSNGTL